MATSPEVNFQPHEFEFIDQVSDPYLLYVEKQPYMHDLAWLAKEELAISYRGVLVGSTLLAHNDVTQRAVLFFSGNNTPYKGAVKKCAEQTNLKKLDYVNAELARAAVRIGKKMGKYRAIGSTTIGPSDPEVIRGITFMANKTLINCECCVGVHTEHPAVPGHFLNTSMTDDGSYRETLSLEETRIAYEHRDRTIFFPDGQEEPFGFFEVQSYVEHGSFPDWQARAWEYRKTVARQQRLSDFQRSWIAKLAITGVLSIDRRVNVTNISDVLSENRPQERTLLPVS